MGLFDLNAKIKFTTECVRYNSAHFIAMWWVNEDGRVWTDKANQTPYLWLVRKGTSGNYNLREATNFDINLQVQNIFTPQYNCRIHTQCNNHKLRIMIIPVCKVPNLSTLYNQFANAFTNAVSGGTNDGDYAIIRLDDNSSYSSAYSSFSAVLKDYIQNTLTSSSQRSYGESIIDIAVVNSAMKDCINRAYQFVNSSNIVTGGSSDFYTICGSTTSSGSTLVVPSYKLFPDPVDSGNTITGFNLGREFLVLRLCHKGLSSTCNIEEQGDILDNQQYPLVDCCNTYELFNVSVSSTASPSFKYFIFYQDADPSSSTFLQFVNQVIRANDPSNYNSSVTIKAIPGSLYVVQQSNSTPNTGTVVYQSSTSNKNFSINIPNGSYQDTLTVTKNGIFKIQCP